jgi:hypothetical protein
MNDMKQSSCDLFEVLCLHLSRLSITGVLSKIQTLKVFIGLLLVLCSMSDYMIIYVKLYSMQQPDGWLNFSA